MGPSNGRRTASSLATDTSAFYRELCENAHDLIQSVAPDGRLLYANRAWREALGYDAAEIEGLNVFDVIHPESREHCQLLMRDVLKGREAREITFSFVAKDGGRVDVEGSASSWLEHGSPVATCGIFRRVTAERRAEMELERLFDQSLDLMCVASLDGYFQQVNPAFVRVLGYSREELLSRSFIEFVQEVVHPEDRSAAIDGMRRLMEGLPVDLACRYHTRQGSWVWLAWRGVPVPERKVVYAVARDVTAEKAAESHMALQAAELARSNADLEQFAYAASHDLRAPLRSIANLSEWIEEDIGNTATPQARHHLNKLRQRVRRMARMTEDLLTYYRAGREGTAQSEVDVAALVQEIVALIGPPEGFAIEAGEGLPVLRTARSPLELVLRNLIGNAVKHHDRSDGRIVVSARRREGFYEVSVEDDGPGIPDAYKERIFGMFETLRTRDEVEGTGLGLALVHRLVTRFGGRVWVESPKKRGSVFRFTWPVQWSEGESDEDAADR